MALFEIRKCSAVEILESEEGQALTAAYAEECMVTDAKPQIESYRGMEGAGMLACFGGFMAGELAGFVSVITTVMPHNGKLVATVESLYASREYRECGGGSALMGTAEHYARERGAVCLTYTARVGSRLETVLALRAGCERTHEVFTKWLNR